MRGRIALQSTACEIHRECYLYFAPAFGVRTRPRVAFAAESCAFDDSSTIVLRRSRSTFGYRQPGSAISATTDHFSRAFGRRGDLRRGRPITDHRSPGNQGYPGVGRGCGVGRALGVALGVAVGGGVGVGVTVAVAVGVGVGGGGVAVALGVGVGVGVPCTASRMFTRPQP
jgi:hypothetical protein